MVLTDFKKGCKMQKEKLMYQCTETGSKREEIKRMTNEELYKAVEGEKKITREVTDILSELDVTASITTQAELNKLLVALYNRLDQEEITIEELDPVNPATKEQFVSWVKEHFDSYSADMFDQSV